MPNYARFLRHQWQLQFGGGLPRELYYPLDAARARGLTVLDVGAFDGGFLAGLERSVRVNRAVLVEPQPEKAARLRTRFPPPDYTVCEAAVSDEIGVMELEVSPGATSTASLLRIRGEMPELSRLDLQDRRLIRVKTDTIEAIADRTALTHIDLMKLDVQGAELLALGGAERALARTTWLYVELSFRPLYAGACLIQEVVDAVREADFILVDTVPEFRSPDGELLQVNGLFRRRGAGR